MGIHVRWPFEASERKLAALRGKGLTPSVYAGLAGRFHFWLGASGRRYVCSVFAAADQAMEGLDLSHSVVIAVVREADGNRRALSIVPNGLPLRLHGSAGNWLGGRAPNEFHVHLLPENREQRDAAYADLQRAFIRRR